MGPCLGHPPLTLRLHRTAPLAPPISRMRTCHQSLLKVDPVPGMLTSQMLLGPRVTKVCAAFSLSPGGDEQVRPGPVKERPRLLGSMGSYGCD